MNTALHQWIKQYKKSKETLVCFFERVLNEKILCHQFLNFIIKNPRENKPLYRYLKHLFPKQRQWDLWQQKYTKCYEAFMRSRWQKAKKIEDVLRIIPNFSPWALKERFGVLKIGSLPSEFGNEKDYNAFLKKIYSSKVMQSYRQFKALEGNLKALSKIYPQIKQIDWFDLEKRGQVLSDILQKIVSRTFHLTHLGHTYRVQYLCNPFSCKMVFKIESDTHKKYILKMQAHQVGTIDSDAKRKESENQAIRADSPYSNALMEFYLKLNKCQNVQDILYYTDTYEAVLYHALTGSELTDTAAQDFKILNTKYLKDANRLGIYVNDISLHNFMWGCDKKLKIIDIGHASFANPLTQGIPGFTFSFGNLCGQDYLIHFGVLSMED